MDLLWAIWEFLTTPSWSLIFLVVIVDWITFGVILARRDRARLRPGRDRPSPPDSHRGAQ